ncbi:hypothetical protein GM182_07490 [bacterium 3DAC]|nr:hypothetical protein GM182_07490 [bacterium 3DAC]
MIFDSNNSSIPKYVRYYFWFMLTILSIFFAEVISASTPYAFLKFSDFITLSLIYGLHILVLGGIVYAYGEPSFKTLYPAGVLFGLYEAYITKVLFHPWWHAALNIGGISVFEVLTIAMFWHPLMSFMVPLQVAQMFTKDRKVFLRFVFEHPLVFAVFCGVIEAMGTQNIGVSVVSLLSGFLVVFVVLGVWIFVLHGDRYDMKALMPQGKEISVLAIMLLLLYIVLGFLWRPEALSGIYAQMFVWCLYIFFGWLLYRNIRQYEDLDNSVQVYTRVLLLKVMIFGLGVMATALLTDVIAAYFPSVVFALRLVVWLGMAVLSLLFVGCALVYIK